MAPETAAATRPTSAAGNPRKRSRAENLAAGAASETGRKRRHRPGSAAGGGSDLAGATLAALRKKLRDTQRVLRRGDKLTAVARQDAERRAKGLESEIKDRKLEEKKNALAQKYKYVKFVERKRAARKLKAAEKTLAAAETPDARAAAERLLRDLKLDYNYIMHFPPLRKYIALRPASGEETSREDREAIRAEIRARLESGEIEDAWGSAATREGRPKFEKRMRKVPRGGFGDDDETPGTGAAGGRRREHGEVSGEEEDGQDAADDGDDDFFLREDDESSGGEGC